MDSKKNFSNKKYSNSNKNIIIKQIFIKEKLRNINKKAYKKTTYLTNMKKNQRIKTSKYRVFCKIKIKSFVKDKKTKYNICRNKFSNKKI